MNTRQQRTRGSAARRHAGVTLTLLAILIPGTASAQRTLAAALEEADHAAYANRIAAGAAATGAARAIAPLQGILPSLRLDGGYSRTTDPIGVFGDRLRQGVITQADFDPQRLNFPSAIGNYQAALILEQPLLNADAWAGRAAATHAAAATQAAANWTRLSVRVDVIRAYYGAMLAAERATTLDVATRAAHAHVTQADAMVRQGLATRSDALLAAVRAGNMDAQLAEARGDVAIAHRRLAILLGRPRRVPDVDTLTAAALPPADRIRAVVERDTAATPESRADVLDAEQQSVAARADASRARSTYLPRINSFARYDWNAPNWTHGNQRSWTVGVMASWSPLGSATELSDIRAAAGRAASARAQADAVAAAASQDVLESRTALAVALIRLRIAEQAVAQSAEAHRIVSRKYEGGLASIVDLLDAQAVATSSALAFSDARYAVIVAAATRRRAVGGDPGTLTALDTPLTTSDEVRVTPTSSNAPARAAHE